MIETLHYSVIFTGLVDVFYLHSPWYNGWFEEVIITCSHWLMLVSHSYGDRVSGRIGGWVLALWHVSWHRESSCLAGIE